MIDVPFNPKADQAIDLLTAGLLKRIYDTADRKFGVQGRFEVRCACRQEFECELSEISITAAKWVLARLDQKPDLPVRPKLPPRQAGTIEGVIATPPDPSLWGPKL